MASTHQELLVSVPAGDFDDTRQGPTWTVKYSDKDSYGRRIESVPVLTVDKAGQVDLVSLKRLIQTWEERALY